MNPKKRLNWKHVSGIAVVVLGIWITTVVHGCNERDRLRAPDPRTDAYYALHGLVPGQVSELQVGEYRFRFPASNFPEPYTSGKVGASMVLKSDIVKGKADQATVNLDFSSWFERPLVNPRQEGALVDVEFWPYLNWGESLKAAQEARLREGPWKAIDDLPKTGLRRFARATSGWGELTYIPMDSAIKTPDGALMLYNCKATFKLTADGKSAYATDQPSICEVSFRHPRGPYISYSLSGVLMPRWQEVHQEVVKFVDSTLIAN